MGLLLVCFCAQQLHEGPAFAAFSLVFASSSLLFFVFFFLAARVINQPNASLIAFFYSYKLRLHALPCVLLLEVQFEL